MDEDYNVQNKWVRCVAVLNFDDQFGQQMVFCYPDVLLDGEKVIITELGMPQDQVDHRATMNMSSVYCFRYTLSDYTAMFGYVLFKVRKDEDSERNYVQHSVIIVSKLDYIQLFKMILEIIGEFFFNDGASDYGENYPLIENVFHTICSWENPSPKTSIQLPILGAVFDYFIPKRSGIIVDSFSLEHDDPSSNLHAINFHRLFGSSFSKYVSLWELVMLGNPIIVVANSSVVCSDSVLSIVSLISPLRYSGEFRPYSSIQDPFYREIEQDIRNCNNLVLGTTNSIIIRNSEWENVLLMDNKSGGPSLTSKHKNTYSQSALNTELRKRTGEFEKNKAIRKFFYEMTRKFMAPIEEYFQELLPHSSAKELKLKPFKESVLLLSLRKLHMPSKYVRFYSQFIRTENFKQWLRKEKKKKLSSIEKRRRE